MSYARSVVALIVAFAVFASVSAYEKKYEKKYVEKKYVEKKYAEKKAVCYEKGERCAGAKGHPYVSYAPCCDKKLMCVEDKEMGWGRFCKMPSKKYWEKCYLNGSRCMGAPGKPYVAYHKCCGGGECVEDKEMGWGMFCKGGKYDTKHEKEYKKVKGYKADKYEKVKKYDGHYYESKDGKMKYEYYYSKKYGTKYPTTTTTTTKKGYGYGYAKDMKKKMDKKKMDKKKTDKKPFVHGGLGGGHIIYPSPAH